MSAAQACQLCLDVLIHRPRCGRYPAYNDKHLMIGTPWVANGKCSRPFASSFEEAQSSGCTVFQHLCTKFAPELLEDERFATEGRADQGKLIINMVAMRRAFRRLPIQPGRNGRGDRGRECRDRQRQQRRESAGERAPRPAGHP